MWFEHRTRRRLVRTARFAASAGLLGVVLWRLGAGPVLVGLRSLTLSSLLAAVGLGCVATVFAAWRWTIVARGLGVSLRLPKAIAAYYRSQLVNTALPGGVVGDVQRGVRHGRDSDQLGTAIRAVAWDRISGQVVQCAVAVLVLAVLPSPMRAVLPVAIGMVGGAVLIIAGCFLWARRPSSRLGRLARVARNDVRAGLLRGRAAPAIVAASLVVVGAHGATALLAIHVTGTRAPLDTLVPIALVTLLSAAIPLNVGGWGPRETATVWAFSASGLSPAAGLATATAFGVMTVCATLPGLAVLVASAVNNVRGSRPARRQRRTAVQPKPAIRAREPVHG